MLSLLLICVIALAVACFVLWRKVEVLELVLRQALGRLYRLEQEQRPEMSPAVQAQPEPVTMPVAPDIPQFRAAAPPRTDWETLIGTNWLNKLGVLAVVAGVALFLGYSLTRLGPWGKIMIGAAIGASMLILGMVLENRRRYTVFAHGLIGGGWAGLYFTVYAMHGVPAARVIESAVPGTALLLAVAVSMVVHSLRYQRQAVTTLAYFTGFASLNVTALTGFSVVATAFLAASLLVIASRFRWFRLALAGILLTYATFVLRYDAEFYARDAILQAQFTLWTYWLAFEGFDLLHCRRNAGKSGFGSGLHWVNGLAFAGASILHRWHMTPREWVSFFGMAAAAYTVSAVLRAWLARPEEEEIVAPPASYLPSAVFAAGFAAAAVIERFDGLRMTFGLILLGELIVLSGFALREKALRMLGAAALALPLIRMFVVHWTAAVTIQAAGYPVKDWAPLASLFLAVLVANRLLTGDQHLYLHAAGLLTLLITLENLARMWVAVAWAVLMAGLVFAAARLPELRWTNVAITAALAVRVAVVNLPLDAGRAVPTGIVAAICFACYIAARRNTHLFLGAAILTVLLYLEADDRFRTVAWAAEAACLVGAGFALRERLPRLCGLGLFLLCIGRLVTYDLRQLDTPGRILSFIVLGVVMLAASWAYARFREQIRRLL